MQASINNISFLTYSLYLYINKNISLNQTSNTRKTNIAIKIKIEATLYQNRYLSAGKSFQLPKAPNLIPRQACRDAHIRIYIQYTFICPRVAAGLVRGVINFLFGVRRHGAGAAIHVYQADFTTRTAGVLEVLRDWFAPTFLHLAPRRRAAQRNYLQSQVLLDFIIFKPRCPAIILRDLFRSAPGYSRCYSAGCVRGSLMRDLFARRSVLESFYCKICFLILEVNC